MEKATSRGSCGTGLPRAEHPSRDAGTATRAGSMNLSFWKGRKVFITGHTGFKGSWLSLWLQRLSANVVGYSLPAPTNPSLYEIADAKSGMESVLGDVRDYRRLRENLEMHRP